MDARRNERDESERIRRLEAVVVELRHRLEALSETVSSIEQELHDMNEAAAGEMTQ